MCRWLRRLKVVAELACLSRLHAPPERVFFLFCLRCSRPLGVAARMQTAKGVVHSSSKGWFSFTFTIGSSSAMACFFFVFRENEENQPCACSSSREILKPSVSLPVERTHGCPTWNHITSSNKHLHTYIVYDTPFSFRPCHDFFWRAINVWMGSATALPIHICCF